LEAKVNYQQNQEIHKMILQCICMSINLGYSIQCINDIGVNLLQDRIIVCIKVTTTYQQHRFKLQHFNPSWGNHMISTKTTCCLAINYSQYFKHILNNQAI
jgi:hypothetical protein